VGKAEKLPKCIETCPERAIDVREVKEDLEKNIFLVGDHLAVHSIKWSREDIQPPKKK
jgi:Fe-S-cluster-containing dehydrogenase component